MLIPGKCCPLIENSVWNLYEKFDLAWKKKFVMPKSDVKIQSINGLHTD